MLVLLRLLGRIGFLGSNRAREFVWRASDVKPRPLSRKRSHPDSRGEDVRPRQREDGTTQHDEGDSNEAGKHKLHALDLALETAPRVFGHRDEFPAKKSARGESGGPHRPIAHFLFYLAAFPSFPLLSFFLFMKVEHPEI